MWIGLAFIGAAIVGGTVGAVSAHVSTLRERRHWVAPEPQQRVG